MARLAGPVGFSGTIDNLTFYQLEGKFYVRKKSSLTKKQFQKDPAFTRSRERAAQFGQAAQLAKQVYCLLPKEKRKHGVIGKLTGQTHQLLQRGQTKEQVIAQLQQAWGLLLQHTLPSAPHPAKGALSLSRWKVTRKGQLQYHYPGTIPCPTIAGLHYKAEPSTQRDQPLTYEEIRAKPGYNRKQCGAT